MTRGRRGWLTLRRKRLSLSVFHRLSSALSYACRYATCGDENGTGNSMDQYICLSLRDLRRAEGAPEAAGRVQGKLRGGPDGATHDAR